MKALTIRQPWAWAIAKGHKDIENRGWTTTHRGPLAIHAAKALDDDPFNALRTIVRIVRAAGGTLPKRLEDDLPHSGCGQIIATVDLDDICTSSLGKPEVACDCGPWAQPGSAHWHLSNARFLPEPVAVKGHLGIWTYESEAA